MEGTQPLQILRVAAFQSCTMARRSASHRLPILPCVLIWLFHFEATFSIPEGIQKVAQAQGIRPEKFLENVSGNAGAYRESNKIAGRVDFMKSLKQAAMELSDLGGFVVCLFEWHRRDNSRCHLSLVRL